MKLHSGPLLQIIFFRESSNNPKKCRTFFRLNITCQKIVSLSCHLIFFQMSWPVRFRGWPARASAGKILLQLWIFFRWNQTCHLFLKPLLPKESKIGKNLVKIKWSKNSIYVIFVKMLFWLRKISRNITMKFIKGVHQIQSRNTLNKVNFV